MRLTIWVRWVWFLPLYGVVVVNIHLLVWLLHLCGIIFIVVVIINTPLLLFLLLLQHRRHSHHLLFLIIIIIIISMIKPSSSSSSITSFFCLYPSIKHRPWTNSAKPSYLLLYPTTPSVSTPPHCLSLSLNLFFFCFWSSSIFFSCKIYRKNFLVVLLTYFLSVLLFQCVTFPVCYLSSALPFLCVTFPVPACCYRLLIHWNPFSQLHQFCFSVTTIPF